MQEFKNIKVTLKNGEQVSIRQASMSDAGKLLEAINTYVPQSDYIPLLEEELSKSVKEKSDWINSFLKHDNSLLLVAEYEDEIIGNIDLTGSSRKIMEHTGLIGMGILKEWRNSGLGTQLVSALIGWSKQHPVLELIWLQVYTENKLGIGLYKKMGFVENGIIKDFFKQDNRYLDNLTMSLVVK